MHDFLEEGGRSLSNESNKNCESKKISRRNLIKAFGVTGALIASGGLMHSLNAGDSETSTNNPHDKIGDLSKLITTDKSSVVGAVNETASELTGIREHAEHLSHAMHGKWIDALHPPAPLQPALIDGTDTTERVQAMLDYLRGQGGGELFFPAGSYKFTGINTLMMSGPEYSNIALTGVKGATIFDFTDRFGVVYKYFLGAFGTFEAGIPLLADVHRDQHVLEVDASGLAEGDLLIITSDFEWEEVSSYGTQQGEYVIIDEILSPAKVRLKSAVHEDYLISNRARIHRIHPIKNITLQGITFKGRGRINNGEGDGDSGVGFTYGQNIVVKDCAFIDIDMTQLEFRSCYHFLAENNVHFHSKYFSSAGSHGEDKPRATSSRGTVQYQIRTADCSMYGTIRNCVGEGGRHMFNTGHSYRFMDGSTGRQQGKLFGVNRYIKVMNCYSKNTWHAGFSTHVDAQYVDFIQCTSENTGLAGFNPRCKNIRVDGCTVINSKYGAYLSDKFQDVEITNCRFIQVGAYVSCTNHYDYLTDVDYRNVRIENNYFEGASEGLYINASSTVMTGELNINNNLFIDSRLTGNYAPIRIVGQWDVNISGNKISGTDSSGYQIRLERVKRAIVSGNIVKDGFRLLYANAECETVVVIDNLFAGHVHNSIDNQAAHALNENNRIL